MICKICQEIFDNKHPWRVHKLCLKEYIEKYEKRLDLYSKELIPFRGDLVKYLETDFVSKTNLRLWLSSQSLKTQKEYCLNLLKKRKEKKELIFTPCQVELKSLSNFPPLAFLDQVFKDDGGYYKVCESLRLKNRFEEFNISTNTKKDSNNEIILVDSREQTLANLNHPIEIATLSYGDYKLRNGNLAIERKSGSDLIGSVIGGYDRICREFDRAQKDNSYIVVLCEEKLQNMLSFPNLPWFSKKIKVQPEFLFHNIRSIIQKYKNLQFLFADGRKETARLIKKLLFNENLIKYDLQNLYGKGLL